MPRTRIKICGVTHPDDAALAGSLGADAVGVVLHAPGARRRIDLGRAREVLDALPPFVTPVGLFADAGAYQIRHAADHLRLRVVQLHGDEPEATVAALAGLHVIKAIPAGDDLDKRLGRWLTFRNGPHGSILKGLLLEPAAHHGGLAGGTGRAGDWDRLGPLALTNTLLPILLAGGLTPETVGSIVRCFRPYAVDVSSGVEGEIYGRKDEGKIEAFIRAVRDAEAMSG